MPPTTASKKSISNEQWEAKLASVRVAKEDMNKLVMNFLVTEGYVDAARMLEQESGTAPGVELGSITHRMEIRKAVQSGQVEEAIDKVNDMDPEILEEQQALFFHLQQQRLIELIRNRKTVEALAFAQEYLAPHGEENEAFLEELERSVSLLAFDEPQASPVGDLMDVAQRQKTASELNAAILSSQGQEREPRLLLLLKMMLWAQQRLDEKAVYPKVTDLAAPRLSQVGS
ncbi:CTLH/CRA C-terminal to lish motif domain-containing protein [Scenedesmus sp. NREL 46B-D3]|nr:CTLH/CRA C-terminal to lish motif domain-containing protein [Scenedesmus sp. NREL 46B-D3]